jgi:hypothetical protein
MSWRQLTDSDQFNALLQNLCNKKLGNPECYLTQMANSSTRALIPFIGVSTLLQNIPNSIQYPLKGVSLRADNFQLIFQFITL